MDLPVFLEKKKVLNGFQKISFPFSWIKNQSGFSLMGVLSASVIGVLVLAGINQLFVNLSARFSLQEDYYKKILFQIYIVDTLGQRQACLNTLGDPLTLNSGNEATVSRLIDGEGNTLIDFTSPVGKQELKRKYGIGDFQQLKFHNYDLHSRDSRAHFDCKENATQDNSYLREINCLSINRCYSGYSN